jgi:hypothetical protein
MGKSFLSLMLTMRVQDDGLSAYMPKTLENKKDNQKKVEPEQPVVEDDDEYEVEEPINDPMMAMMPMSFGKQDRKKDLAASFAKTKRTVSSANTSNLKPPQPKVTVSAVDEEEDDDSDDMIGPMPAEAENLEEEVEDEDEDDDEFPVSHEIILKDHTKAYFLFNFYLSKGCFSNNIRPLRVTTSLRLIRLRRQILGFRRHEFRIKTIQNNRTSRRSSNPSPRIQSFRRLPPRNNILSPTSSLLS